MTADELLAISQPEDLFFGDIDKTKQRYRELARQWHPDLGGDGAVFAQITYLYGIALDRLARGLWRGQQQLVLEDATDGTHHLSVQASTPFPLGQSLVGMTFAAWLVEAKHDDSLKRMMSAPSAFHYATPRMRDEFARYLPSQVTVNLLKDQRYLVQVTKYPDMIRLRDLVTHLGPLDPKHVAWIVSSLLNLACYLSWAGITNNDISPDTYFVSPQHHHGALLGWWHRHMRGEQMRSVPRRTYDILPHKVRVTKRASAQTDLELIRLTARECLAPGAPEPMRRWLTNVGQGEALEQYRQWQEILKRSFGERRYVPFVFDIDAVYESKGATNGKHK